MNKSNLRNQEKVNDSFGVLLVPLCQRDLKNSKLSFFVSLLKTNITNKTNKTPITNITINTSLLYITKINKKEEEQLEGLD